jgi:hypothetical protein
MNTNFPVLLRVWNEFMCRPFDRCSDGHNHVKVFVEEKVTQGGNGRCERTTANRIYALTRMRILPAKIRWLDALGRNIPPVTSRGSRVDTNTCPIPLEPVVETGEYRDRRIARTPRPCPVSVRGCDGWGTWTKSSNTAAGACLWSSAQTRVYTAAKRV